MRELQGIAFTDAPKGFVPAGTAVAFRSPLHPSGHAFVMGRNAPFGSTGKSFRRTTAVRTCPAGVLGLWGCACGHSRGFPLAPAPFGACVRYGVQCSLWEYRKVVQAHHGCLHLPCGRAWTMGLCLRAQQGLSARPCTLRGMRSLWGAMLPDRMDRIVGSCAPRVRTPVGQVLTAVVRMNGFPVLPKGTLHPLSNCAHAKKSTCRSRLLFIGV